MSATTVLSVAQVKMEGGREGGRTHRLAEQSAVMDRAGLPRKPGLGRLCSQAPFWMVSSIPKSCYGKKDGDKVAGREKQHNHLAGSERLQMPFCPKEKAGAWTLCSGISSKQHRPGKTSPSAHVHAAVLDNSNSFTISGFDFLCITCRLYCVKPI